MDINLAPEDCVRLKKDIKSSVFFILLFGFGLALLLEVVPLVMLLMGMLAVERYVSGSLFILLLSMLIITPMLWRNVARWRDLKSGIKQTLTSDNYTVIPKGDTDYLIVAGSPDLTIELPDDLAPHIKAHKTITIELTHHSKTLLFISHDMHNLLDRLDQRS